MTDAPVETRTLVLLRHAKAEQGSAGTHDADRPLSARGHADAAAAGAWLAHHGLLPDVVICSTALRTRQTWHGVAMGMTGSPPEGGPAGPRPTVRYEPGAYDSHPEELLTLVRTIDPTAGTALLIAHNPGISLLSALLDPEGVGEEGLRTTELAIHHTALGWAELDRAGAPITARHAARG
ncbi:histidine phosphatase family protein [Micromonospora acroterricola]|uniref:Histidine phosphatase family protein n=1 Tax=Micromonospora acroterricola TaxID=2202421 RepID=A0A317CYC4_9ACTN|nr:histidine phosphatase family protein [Micromonospora acroterricola]PWR07447.1 histidine phosphatase family protein [Micromonospora acroterricola]